MAKYVPFSRREWWSGARGAKTGHKRGHKKGSKAHLHVHVHGPHWEHMSEKNTPRGPLG